MCKFKCVDVLSIISFNENEGPGSDCDHRSPHHSGDRQCLLPKEAVLPIRSLFN